MTFRVKVLPGAERDIREQALWIRYASRSPDQALRWARSIRAKIKTLTRHPLRCPIDPDSRSYGEDVRVMLHGKGSGVYRVLFIVRGDTVSVITVRHSARGGPTGDPDPRGSQDD